MKNNSTIDISAISSLNNKSNQTNILYELYYKEYEYTMRKNTEISNE
jgi:hypothetical protein